MTETWDFLHSPANSAAFNMALDEALLRTLAKRGRPLLRLYAWEKPSVSFGYFQKFPAHLADRYEVVRRPTGGGLVYHGDDTTYTVVVPPEHALYEMTTTEAYCALHKAVAAALEFGVDVVGRVPSRGAVVTSDSPARGSGHAPMIASRNYECFQKPVQGDVIADGRKLAGGAQRRTKRGLLHQGSIAAHVTVEKLMRGFREVLGMSFHIYELSDVERALAGKLAYEKYATDAWNRR